MNIEKHGTGILIALLLTCSTAQAQNYGYGYRVPAPAKQENLCRNCDQDQINVYVLPEQPRPSTYAERHPQPKRAESTLSYKIGNSTVIMQGSRTTICSPLPDGGVYCR